MNFLLHRHLAERDLASVAAGVGGMLPDLWRMADRRVRAVAAGEHEPLRSEEPAAALMEGIAHHLRTDAWFHRSAPFLDGERVLGGRLRTGGFLAPRMGLLAHIAWELVLDGALVRKLGVSAVLARLRHGLTSVDRELTRRAAHLHHFARTQRSFEQQSAFHGHMQLIAERLCEGRWVAAYGTAEGLAEIVSAMRRRLGLSELGEADRAELAGIFGGLSEAADAALEELMAVA